VVATVAAGVEVRRLEDRADPSRRLVDSSLPASPTTRSRAGW
jgi:hypothetical protein